MYFSDINAGKIYKWSSDGSVSVFVSGLNMPNGLAFDKNGNLIACEGGAGRLISIDPKGQITVLTDQYNGQRYNEPNDLWIDPQGGIYFTDPVYQLKKVQAGEDVYYLSPDRQQVTRVIDDLVRPNGSSARRMARRCTWPITARARPTLTPSMRMVHSATRNCSHPRVPMEWNWMPTAICT